MHTQRRTKLKAKWANKKLRRSLREGSQQKRVDIRRTVSKTIPVAS